MNSKKYKKVYQELLRWGVTTDSMVREHLENGGVAESFIYSRFQHRLQEGRLFFRALGNSERWGDWYPANVPLEEKPGTYSLLPAACGEEKYLGERP
jgi:hypothetical protein